MSQIPTKQREQERPEHLIEVCAGTWAFWSWAALRGAGFPAGNIFKLSAPGAAQTADLCLDAEDREREARGHLLAQINAELDLLKENGEWSNSSKRRPLLKALSIAKAGKVPKNAEFRNAAQMLELQRERAGRLRVEFLEKYEASVRSVSSGIREIAASDRLREAILWQNRRAIHTGVDQILKRPDGGLSRTSRQKQHEELMASYIQRYFVKNDTIGFFGPVGWARLTPNGEGVALRHGSGFVTARKTYFEAWCIEGLAEKIASSKRMRPWLKPLLSPYIRIDGTMLVHPVYGAIRVPAVQAALLSLCDGKRTARDIVRVAQQSSRFGSARDDEVYGLLDQMETKGLISWAFHMPLDPFPERLLRRSLEDIGDYDLRREALASLDELEKGRGAVAASAGNAENLDRALEDLDRVFTDLTGAPPTREAGKMYAGRTLVYEDCRRDLDVRVGRDILESLADPLSLLLVSGRWVTFEVAKAFQRVLRRIYDDVVRKGSSRRVDASSFWVRAMPLVYGEESRIIEPILADYKKRWEGLLLFGDKERCIHHSVEQLRPRVLAEFAAAKPGWRGAHYHSPDIMIQAPSLAHVNRGEYQFILGELHLGRNTLAASVFFNQHPSPGSLVRARELDLPGSMIVPVAPREISKGRARTMSALVSPNDFHLEFARDSFGPERSKALPVSAFFISEENGELIAGTWDGHHRFTAIELIGDRLGEIVCDSFRILAARPHTPRISIDRLVISRETWRFAAAELEFAFEKDEACRFLGARRWARRHCMPRCVFAKAPVETKPCFVALDSPIYVDVLSKIVRRTVEKNREEPGHNDGMITVTEMLPDPDQTWLEDAEGQRYTSEIRIVALDLIE